MLREDMRCGRCAQAFTFEQAPAAHRLSEGGHVRGKLVLTPR
jgi:NADPH:quinone reductase-like Zn-dependent oxidoreductase